MGNYLLEGERGCYVWHESKLEMGSSQYTFTRRERIKNYGFEGEYLKLPALLYSCFPSELVEPMNRSGYTRPMIADY